MVGNKRFIIIKNGRYGMCDFFGNEIVEHAFDEISETSQLKLTDVKLDDSLYIAKLLGKYGLISYKKIIVLPFAFNSIEELKENICLIPSKYILNPFISQ